MDNSAITPKGKRGRPKRQIEEPNTPIERSRSREIVRGKRGRPPKLIKHHSLDDTPKRTRVINEDEASQKTLSDGDEDFEEEESKVAPLQQRNSSKRNEETIEAKGDDTISSQLTSESKTTPAAAPIKVGKRGSKPLIVKKPVDAATLQIDIDIEEDCQKKVIQEKEQVDTARKKFPILFKIFDERCSLKFKSPIWMKQQALKRSNAAAPVAKISHHIYKNLK